MPTLKQKGNPSPFMILPLDENNQVMNKSSPITTRAEYIQSASSWKRVVIQDEKGKYLSCGTYFLPTQGAVASFEKDIKESTQFELKYNYWNILIQILHWTVSTLQFYS